jgi:cell division protein FtsA
VPEGEELDIAAFGEQVRQRIERRELAQVLHARAHEIATLILQEIKRSGYDGLLPAGVVLCGGASQLPGLREVVRDVIGLPVRVGRPHDLQGLVDVLANPAYATSVGLLLWGQDQEPIVHEASVDEPSITGRVVRWFRNLLPD